MFPKIRKYRLVSNISLLFITFVWGATFTLTKNALASVEVYPFLFVRFLVATIVLSVIVFLTPRSRRSYDLRTLWLGVSLGILLFGAYAFQTMGLGHTSPSITGFLTGLYVVLVPILSIPLFRTSPHWRTWMGTIIAVIGLAFISGSDILHLKVGDIQVLICAVFLALQILLIEKYGSGMDSLALATIEILVVAVCSLIVSVFQGGTDLLSMHLWLQSAVFWAVLINAILGTSLAYWGQNVFQQSITSAQIAVIFSMEPVFAALVAWMAQRNALSTVEIVGGVLIFISMLVADPNVSWIRLPGNRSLERNSTPERD